MGGAGRKKKYIEAVEVGYVVKGRHHDDSLEEKGREREGGGRREKKTARGEGEKKVQGREGEG